jgi:CRP-like cAMP-binding protein
LFEAGRLVAYRSDDIIYLEDSPAQGLFAVVEGAVRMEKADHAGRRVLLHIASPGFWFGEQASAGGIRTMVTTQAFGPVKAWHVPPHAVAQAVRNSQELSAHLYTLMAERVVALADLVSNGTTQHALPQIAARLARMDHECRICDSAVQISMLPMRQEDLADMTGHARQTVNAAIKRLEREGLIKVGHRRITILDRHGLDAFCSKITEEIFSRGSDLDSVK